MNDRNDDKKTGAGAGAGLVGGAAAGGVAGGAAAGTMVGGMTGPVGAAVGAAVGAGIGALGGGAAGKAAGSDDDTSRLGSSGGGQGRHTVIGAFDDAPSAQRAVERLTQSGFDRDDVHLEHEEGTRVQERPAQGERKSGGFFASLFGMDEADTDRSSGTYDTYDEAARRGSAIVVVDVEDAQRADRAATLLHEAGAVDVDERAKQWRAEGWQPTGATQQPIGGQQNLTGRQGNLQQDQTLEVVEEQLQVGKRTMDRGGVRVVQRVSSKPVRELIRLREEHAVVERRPVDRPATGQDLTAFKEGTLEVRETAEEAVVAKSARVVEEVRVGKEVREREETIEDNVRRKDVDVERVAGQGGGRTTKERERAVASDIDPVTGTRRNTGKDKPGL